MKTRGKRVFSILISLMVMCTMTACGSKEDAVKTKDGKVKIRAYLGGGDLSEKIDALAADFNAQSKTTEVEVVPMPADTSSMITVMFNSGNTPTVMGLETGDLLRAKDRLADLSDLSAVEYASAGTIDAARDGEAVYGVPYRIEGMGLIYNRAVLDDVLGESFDPDSIHTREDLRMVFEEIEKAGIAPIVLGAQDWSLSTHLATDIYTGQSEDPQEQAAFVDKLKRGEEDLASNEVFQEVMDTIDLLKEYNYHADNPLLYANDGDTTKQARILTEGKAAFWFQGNWGSTALESLDPEGEYGMIPLPVGEDDSYPNNRIATLVPMYLTVFNGATEEQQQSGRELIEYITQTERGWEFVVNDAKGIPAYDNAAVAVENGIASSILNYQEKGRTKVAYMANTADHYVDTGAALQRYLDGQISREEVAEAYEAYWRAK
ncbi:MULTISPECIES: ABC transporter substrate-binding protein [Blautia]|uniref:ABC transporter substrate-binding protein n=1 Tax=Blautia TaxID=572511 RepID=UPI00138FE960|nr:MULTISPECIES: ABC transporter substrate-binding protein [Blautia]